jgi:hypothetical protein
MEYEGYDSAVSVEACPPIVDPQHHVTDYPTDEETRTTTTRGRGRRDAGEQRRDCVRVRRERRRRLRARAGGPHVGSRARSQSP